MVIDFCDKDQRGEIMMDDFCQTILQAQKLQQQQAAEAASAS